MKGRIKTEALVISRRNIGEADRLITFFTRDFGLIKAVAKGVRKIPSTRGGHLEPYTQVLAILSASRAGVYVAGVESINHYPDLHENEDAMISAKNMSYVLTGLFEEQEIQDSLFDAISHAWEILPALSRPHRFLLEIAVIMHALRSGGVMPQLAYCQSCGAAAKSETIILNAQEGGWNCLLCKSGFAGTKYSLSPRLLKVLRYIDLYPNRALKIKIEDIEADQLIQAVRTYAADATKQPLLIEHTLSYASF